MVHHLDVGTRKTNTNRSMEVAIQDVRKPSTMQKDNKILQETETCNKRTTTSDTNQCELNPRPPKGGCCNPLRFFLKLTAFLLNKLRQTLLCNCFKIYNASFDVYEVKFEGVVWVWEVVKDYDDF